MSVDEVPDVPNAEYSCVVGHRIPETDLDERTEVVTMDKGAVVRLCREHGAPVAISVSPTTNLDVSP